MSFSSPLDLLRNSISLVKSIFLTPFLSNLSTICIHMFSKFDKKVAQKRSIFSNKANYARDLLFFLILALFALLIWVRDLRWSQEAADAFPILVSLPLFFWLGKPWNLREKAAPYPLKIVFISVLLLLVGILINLSSLLALGWVLLLWGWILSHIKQEEHSRLMKLLILPLMAFPWVIQDGETIGWWFRLSGAKTTAWIFSHLGANVIQEGTQILINGLPISVEVACAGLNTLQSMLIAGSILAYVYLGNCTQRYIWGLVLLVALAWIANTIRIIVISAIALTMGSTFAIGAFHTWGGWLVLVVMFLLAWALFSFMEKKEKS